MIGSTKGLSNTDLPRLCSPGRFREMLLAALSDPQDRQPALDACEFPAMQITMCMAEFDEGGVAATASRNAGLKGRRLAKQLCELLEAEQVQKQGLLDWTKERQAPAGSPDHAQRCRFLRLRELDVKRNKARLNAANEMMESFASKIGDVPDWHDMAIEILDAFRTAMKPANPGRSYGISVPGPAVRFVGACLKEIAGQEQKLETIAQALRRSPVTNGGTQFVTEQINDGNL